MPVLSWWAIAAVATRASTTLTILAILVGGIFFYSAFAVMFGLANGLCTIARGAVPLALFGPAGYGRIIGRIARPSLVITAIAPVVIAFVAERASDPVALAVAAGFAVVSLICFSLVRR